MLVFVWPSGSLRDHRHAAEVFFVYGAFAPPCWALGSTWHLEHHCNRKKMGGEREKLLFHFSTQWDSPLGLLTMKTC